MKKKIALGEVWRKFWKKEETQSLRWWRPVRTKSQVVTFQPNLPLKRDGFMVSFVTFHSDMIHSPVAHCSRANYRTTLDKKKNHSLIGVSFECPYQHPPWYPVSIGRPAPKIHQWTIYFCRWGFGWVEKAQCFRSARRFGAAGLSPDFSRVFHGMALLGLCLETFFKKKKKNHRGDASCDIEESAVWFRRDASMREVAAVTSRIRSRFRSWIKHPDSSISQDSDFMHQQHGSFFCPG